MSDMEIALLTIGTLCVVVRTYIEVRKYLKRGKD